MRYFSLNDKNHKASFKEAVIKGIAPDKGLYFPEQIQPLPPSFFEEIEDLSNHEIAFHAVREFVGGDISDDALQQIVAATLDFEFPLVSVEDNISALELFHGPTMAFKDVGARFMANCLGHFSGSSDDDVTVLVATSGDTGGAVANGFLGVEGVKVVILYPNGKVSDIQERQLTTLGQNITAIRVWGTFDDCQQMVKRAFLDTGITHKRKLTSANSINVARWLPQMFYYFFAYRDAKKQGKDIVFSVPSGNFGNICAGMMAQRLGMPVKHFIAATNVNDVVPNYMQSAQYDPKPSIATISNAMDVGDPSNFVRIQRLFENDFEKLQQHLFSFSFSDDDTKAGMQEVFQRTDYVMDPHGAVGYLGLKKYMENHPEVFGIFLETAHPIKFLDVVKETLDVSLELPPQIQTVMGREKKSIPIEKYEELKDFLRQ